MNEFDTNANYISALHERIETATAESDELYIEFKRIENAAKFMEQLIGIIKKNPVVYDEWLVFLEKAGIPEPEWKAEYGLS